MRETKISGKSCPRADVFAYSLPPLYYYNTLADKKTTNLINWVDEFTKKWQSSTIIINKDTVRFPIGKVVVSDRLSTGKDWADQESLFR